MTVHHPHRRPQRHPRAVVATVSVATALLLGACGDDDDNADGSGAAPATVADTTAATAADAGAAGAASTVPAVCPPYLEVTAQFNDEPNPDELGAALDELDANTPAELAASLGTMTSAARAVMEAGGEDFSPFETPEFVAAQTEVDGWVFANCEFDATYEVTATEYAFEGMPAEVASGLVAVKLTNEGQEAHEIGVARKVDGTTETWDELLELPEEEAEAKVEFIGGGFAPTPGSVGVAILDTSKGGEFAALCFIPTGTVMTADGDVTEGSGPPHFAQGMIHEFTVG
jgi:hypothetical protein